MTVSHPHVQDAQPPKAGTVSQERDTAVDIIRGLAIFTMIAANTAGEMLTEPHPFWFRLYGSFAAPLFILMSGMMVALTAEGRKHDLRYFVKRGAMVVAVGALIDILVWHIYPFTTIDVLYLIGISLPLIFLFVYLKPTVRWLLIVIVFGMGPLLQFLLGYAPSLMEVGLLENPQVLFANLPTIFRHWIVDGWFPIFPWLGFSFLGVQLAQWRWKCDQHALGSGASFLAGAIILAAGAVVFFLMPSARLTREGYSELFYPPTVGFILCAIGVIIVLFPLADKVRGLIVLDPLKALGESSLFMYIVHLAIIEYVILTIFKDGGFSISGFMGLYAVFTVVLILAAYGVRQLKRVWTTRPFVVRFLLGG